MFIKLCRVVNTPKLAYTQGAEPKPVLEVVLAYNLTHNKKDQSQFIELLLKNERAEYFASRLEKGIEVYLQGDNIKAEMPRKEGERARLIVCTVYELRITGNKINAKHILERKEKAASSVKSPHEFVSQHRDIN